MSAAGNTVGRASSGNTERAIPSKRSLLEALAPLALWYHKNRPEVDTIAVTPEQLLRARKLAEAKERLFQVDAAGEVFYDGFSLRVVSQ
jgi:hypothetical protein